MMLTETFVTSIRAQQRTANTAIAKDIGIYVHDLYPTPTVKATFKKSSTQSNSLAANTTHIFAAQIDKAVIHVYSRDRGNQEALIPFSERIHSLELVDEGLVALGTAEGRIILWEICTGKQASTTTSHLQAVSCLASTSQFLLSGSADSNIQVWSITHLLSEASESTSVEPIRSLSNHRAAITSIATGHSMSETNICVSTSRDNTAVVWNYNTGSLLRTFLLPNTPLCVELDPCDRCMYVGMEDGSIQPVNLFDPRATTNSLYDPALQSTPVQITSSCFAGAPAEVGAANCLAVSYDGTILITGHENGKLLQWETGLKKYSTEIADLNAPVTNIRMESPFLDVSPTKAINVVKPRLGAAPATFTGQFTTSLESDHSTDALYDLGFSSELLQEAVASIHTPSDIPSSDAAALQKENEDLQKQNKELRELVDSQRELQRALQKRPFDKFQKT